MIQPCLCMVKVSRVIEELGSATYDIIRSDLTGFCKWEGCSKFYLGRATLNASFYCLSDSNLLSKSIFFLLSSRVLVSYACCTATSGSTKN